MNKYHNRRTVIDGITFDSKKEANYYCKLKLLVAGKVVKDFERQVEFVLQEKFTHNKKVYRPIKYLADFVVNYVDGHKEIVDVKGFRTKDYNIKKKMLLKQLHDKGMNTEFVEV